MTSDTTRALPRVDLERFRADLREGGVEEMVGTLLATFVQDCPARFASLEQAIQQGSAKAVEIAAHAFKSGAGAIRATVLAAALANIEAVARTGHLESAPELLKQIRDEYIAVVREIETNA